MEADAMISVTMCSKAARRRLKVSFKQSLCTGSLSFGVNAEEPSDSISAVCRARIARYRGSHNAWILTDFDGQRQMSSVLYKAGGNKLSYHAASFFADY
jgi:hypothetical protein